MNVMQLAVVENDVITHLQQGGTLEFADAAGLPLVPDEVQIGWIADPTSPGNFRPPFDTVPKYRFLFELFSNQEQVILDARHNEAAALTSAEMLDPQITEYNAALVVMRNAKQRFDSLTVVELGASATVAFLQACKTVGVFGEDATAADTRIEAIQANTDSPV
jgi:hypothetical protein